MGEEKKRSDWYTKGVLTVIALVLILLLVRTFVVKERSTVTPTPEKESELDAIDRALKEAGITVSWKDTHKYYGEYKTVEGTIVNTYNSGKACFLNFHPNWKKYFTVVIFRSDFGKFPSAPENYYYGKKVRVSGYIKEYQGKPEIIAKDPSQIEIIK